MDNNTDFTFNAVTSLRATSVFSLEGGRLAAIEQPIRGELCPKQVPNGTFGSKSRSMVMGVPVADARTYTFRTGSDAPGGSG